MAWRTTTLLPTGDMFSWLARWLAWQQDGDWMAYLWAPHNEHRLPVIRLLVAIDARIDGGAGLCLSGAALMALLALAGAAYAAARRLVVREGGLREACWLAPMLVLTTAAAADVGSPINCVFPLVVTCGVAAVLLAQRAGGGRMTAALCAGLLATGCGAWGFAAWPAILWSARHVWGRWVKLTLCGPIAGYSAWYLQPVWQAMPWHAGAPQRAPLLFLLSLAGLPFSRAQALWPLGPLVGGMLLSAAAACLLAPPGRQHGGGQRGAGQHRRRCGRALILLGLTGALCVTVGRAGLEAPDRLPARYTILLLPLYLGLYVSVLPRLRRPSACALAVGLLVVQVASAPPAVRIAADRQRQLARFYAGERDAAMRQAIFPDLDRAQAIVWTVRDGGKPAAAGHLGGIGVSPAP